MLVLVSYDVNTEDAAGRRRLRRIARLCTSWGQRVQFSVFECLVDTAQWVRLRAALEAEIADTQKQLEASASDYCALTELTAKKESLDAALAQKERDIIRLRLYMIRGRVTW